MAARIWFTPENSMMGHVSKPDLDVMNRAVRNLVSSKQRADDRLLSTVRMVYKPGMSAQDIIDLVEDSDIRTGE